MSSVEFEEDPNGKVLRIRTPGRYAMDLAIEFLVHLDGKPGYRVKNTDWKQGFGIKVCDWLPLESQNLDVQLMTDGDQIDVRLVRGGREEFGQISAELRAVLRNQ